MLDTNSDSDVCLYWNEIQPRDHDPMRSKRTFLLGLKPVALGLVRELRAKSRCGVVENEEGEDEGREGRRGATMLYSVESYEDRSVLRSKSTRRKGVLE